jgi:ABC-2 type transport system permease protein
MMVRKRGRACWAFARSYLALLGAGFRRQTTYRLALAAGLATAAFFGVVRTAVFFALYRERDQVAGLDVADAVTYVWVLQGLFAVVWAPWFWEHAEAIRSGEFVVELLRPAAWSCPWPAAGW